MAFFHANMIEVHVLLFGNDMVSLLDTRKLLEFNSYEVTAVSVAAVASSLLAKEKGKYDVVMVDVSPSDVQGFQLAHDAINLGYTVILMSDNPNPTLVKCAIEDGAFMFIQKPATMEVLKYLWQHVLRENTRKSKESARFREMVSTIESSNFILNSGQNMIHPSTIEANVNLHEFGSRNVVHRNGLEGFMFGPEDENLEYRGKKPKICTEWTQELHEKFVEVVKELGDGRCFPRDILEAMNVPGLTRMQVASHLQKCRQGLKAAHEEGQQNGSSVSSTSNGPNYHSKPKRRGSYPRIAKGAQPKFLVRNKEKDEQAATTKPVEDSIGSVEPENMKQNIVISDNASNKSVNVTGISCGHTNGEVVVESNHEGWTIPFDDSFDFAIDNSYGINVMDYNFEGFGVDQTFSQAGVDQTFSQLISSASDEEPGSFWRSFFSNFSSEQD
ncbi:hypothetical protein F511_16792 [Dorcoceras hygrometricum]|uniref:Response regulatory domain-containing protein n=1 Tax=Dorcoceras hygrometricum TaxID=472368 RepID=A0A2Z7CN60_9LAMI|nr:hypothetical protein F511_16792 [Dorcoceras hygrometricum]